MNHIFPIKHAVSKDESREFMSVFPGNPKLNMEY